MDHMSVIAVSCTLWSCSIQEWSYNLLGPVLLKHTPLHVCMLLPDQHQQMLGAAIRHPDNVQVPQLRHISQSLTEKFVLATYPRHVNFKAPDLQHSPLLPAGGCTFGGVHAGNVCLLQHGTLRAAVERRSCTESVPAVLQPLGSPCPRPAPRYEILARMQLLRTKQRAQERLTYP